MPTLKQLVLKGRKSKRKFRWSPQISGCPQRRGICLRVGIMKPKKPNSAIRKIAKLRFYKTKKNVLVYIPGQGHTLQKYSVVLARGGRVKDLPGGKYH